MTDKNMIIFPKMELKPVSSSERLLKLRLRAIVVIMSVLGTKLPSLFNSMIAVVTGSITDNCSTNPASVIFKIGKRVYG